jgi:hypothetical protein
MIVSQPGQDRINVNLLERNGIVVQQTYDVHYDEEDTTM